MKCQWTIGSGGMGRAMGLRIVMALCVRPEQENKETANNDRRGLTGTCFTLLTCYQQFLISEEPKLKKKKIITMIKRYDTRNTIFKSFACHQLVYTGGTKQT